MNDKLKAMMAEISSIISELEEISFYESGYKHENFDEIRTVIGNLDYAWLMLDSAVKALDKDIL